MRVQYTRNEKFDLKTKKPATATEQNETLEQWQQTRLIRRDELGVGIYTHAHTSHHITFDVYLRSMLCTIKKDGDFIQCSVLLYALYTTYVYGSCVLRNLKSLHLSSSHRFKYAFLQQLIRFSPLKFELNIIIRIFFNPTFIRVIRMNT